MKPVEVFVKILVMEDAQEDAAAVAQVVVIPVVVSAPEVVEAAVPIIVIKAVKQDAKMLVAVPHAQQPAEQHVLDLPDQLREIQINMEANKIYGDNK